MNGSKNMKMHARIVFSFATNCKKQAKSHNTQITRWSFHTNQSHARSPYKLKKLASSYAEAEAVP